MCDRALRLGAKDAGERLVYGKMSGKKEKINIREDVRRLKREIIVREATDLFIEKGYSNTKVEEIAIKCGVTKPFVYYHFESKMEILCEICVRATLDAYAAVNSVNEIDDSAMDKFSLLFRAFLDAALKNYNLVEIYYREAVNLPSEVASNILEMRVRIEEIFVALIREGVASGEFNVSDVRMTARTILSMGAFSFAWYGRARKDDIGTVIDRMDEVARKLIA